MGAAAAEAGSDGIHPVGREVASQLVSVSAPDRSAVAVEPLAEDDLPK